LRSIWPLNNAAYIDYIINAREDQLNAHYGINLYKYAQEEKKAWVVASHKIDYLYPAKVMEELTVCTRVLSYTQKSITIEGVLKNQERKYTRMETTFVFVDLKSGRPTDHTDEWMNFLESVVNP
jgi:YbgC/YbaW family acyl-CoA thioester hydrolase